MATVAAVHTILFWEPVTTATTRVITSMTSKVRESSYKLYSHADTYVFVRGTLIVYYFKRPINIQGYDPSQGSSE